MATMGFPRERSRQRHTTIAEDAAARRHATTPAIDEPTAVKRLTSSTAAAAVNDPSSAPSLKTAAVQPRPIQLSIKATSIFSPASWDCALCQERNNFDNRLCHGPRCGSPFRWSYTMLTHTGAKVDPARFPVHWVCGSCDLVHFVINIIDRDVRCTCGQPELRAVYDQFGDLFLCWRDDEKVRDLREMRMVEEAARRLWIAGGERWANIMPRICLEDDGVDYNGKGKEMMTVLVGEAVMC